MDDAIGGWSVTTVDKPTSQQNFLEGDTMVADCMTKRDAEFIAWARNNAIGFDEALTAAILTEGSGE